MHNFLQKEFFPLLKNTVQRDTMQRITTNFVTCTADCAKVNTKRWKTARYRVSSHRVCVCVCVHVTDRNEIRTVKRKCVRGRMCLENRTGTSLNNIITFETAEIAAGPFVCKYRG